MDEFEYLPSLLNCIEEQTYNNFELYVCVNQPELWWNDYWILFEFLWFKKKIEICGKTLREAIYNYVTWKKEENI